MVQFRHSLYFWGQYHEIIFPFVPVKPWCQWGFFFNFHRDRNSTVLYLAEGKEKCLELLEKNLVSRNEKQLWFTHFSREHFDPEKDKFCSSLGQRRKMFTQSPAPNVEGYQRHLYTENSQQRNCGEKQRLMHRRRRKALNACSKKDDGWNHAVAREVEAPQETLSYSTQPSSTSTPFLNNMVKWGIYSMQGPSKSQRNVWTTSLSPQFSCVFQGRYLIIEFPFIKDIPCS